VHTVCAVFVLLLESRVQVVFVHLTNIIIHTIVFHVGTVGLISSCRRGITSSKIDNHNHE
jgi:hypothetical protein